MVAAGGQWACLSISWPEILPVARQSVEDRGNCVGEPASSTDSVPSLLGHRPFRSIPPCFSAVVGIFFTGDTAGTPRARHRSAPTARLQRLPTPPTAGKGSPSHCGGATKLGAGRVDLYIPTHRAMLRTHPVHEVPSLAGAKPCPSAGRGGYGGSLTLGWCLLCGVCYCSLLCCGLVAIFSTSHLPRCYWPVSR